MQNICSKKEVRARNDYDLTTNNELEEYLCCFHNHLVHSQNKTSVGIPISLSHKLGASTDPDRIAKYQISLGAARKERKQSFV